MKFRKSGETWWGAIKRWGLNIGTVLVLVLIAIAFYAKWIDASCHDKCKEAGYETGNANINGCRCITYTPYEGEW